MSAVCANFSLFAVPYFTKNNKILNRGFLKICLQQHNKVFSSALVRTVMGVGRARAEGLSRPWIFEFSEKKVVFLVLSWKNHVSLLLAPPLENFRKNLLVHPWKKILPTPMCKVFVIRPARFSHPHQCVSSHWLKNTALQYTRLLYLCVQLPKQICEIPSFAQIFKWFKYLATLLLLLGEFFFYPLLGRARFRGRCWAAIRLSHRPEPSGHAVHGQVDRLDIEGKHGRRFVLLHHAHRPQRPYPTRTNRSGNVRHRCGGGWSEPRLFLGRSFGECGYRQCRISSTMGPPKSLYKGPPNCDL